MFKRFYVVPVSLFEGIRCHSYVIFYCCAVVGCDFSFVYNALYKTLSSSGHSFAFWQLHGSEVGGSLDNNLWLWLEMVDLMLLMHE